SARRGEFEGPTRRSAPACRKCRWFCARRSAAASPRPELLQLPTEDRAGVGRKEIACWTLGTVTANDQRQRYRSAARTHVGAVRKRNEDAVLNRPEIGLWAVADGAGGHQRGDYASERIIAALGQVAPPPSAALLIDDVKTRLRRANRELLAK